MNIKKIITSGAILALGVAMLPISAFAVSSTVNTTVEATANAAAAAPAGDVKVSVDAKTAAKISSTIASGDKAIADRIAKLTDLQTRMADMKNLDAATKANLSTAVQTNISGLTDLKTKIDADTDLLTLKTDSKNITEGFRIYALVIPQGWIAASADRITNIAAMFATIGTKLQTRLTTEQTAGNDITAAQAALTDMNAKIIDAQKQAGIAVSTTTTLSPDNGDKTIAASNTATLKTAKVGIKTAMSDLVAARADAKIIMTALQSFEAPKTTTSTDATTNTNTNTNTSANVNTKTDANMNAPKIGVSAKMNASANVAGPSMKLKTQGPMIPAKPGNQ